MVEKSSFRNSVGVIMIYLLLVIINFDGIFVMEYVKVIKDFDKKWYDLVWFLIDIMVMLGFLNFKLILICYVLIEEGLVVLIFL